MNLNKKISIIPLLILLIFALLAGICYKKFIKKIRRNRKNIKYSNKNILFHTIDIIIIYN